MRPVRPFLTLRPVTRSIFGLYTKRGGFLWRRSRFSYCKWNVNGPRFRPQWDPLISSTFTCVQSSSQTPAPVELKVNHKAALPSQRGPAIFSLLVNLSRRCGSLRYDDGPFKTYRTHSSLPSSPLCPHHIFSLPSIVLHVFPATRYPLHPPLVLLRPCRHYSQPRQRVCFPILVVSSYQTRRVCCGVVCRLFFLPSLSRSGVAAFWCRLIRPVTLAEC